MNTPRALKGHSLKLFTSTIRDAGAHVTTGFCACGWRVETTHQHEARDLYRQHLADAKAAALAPKPDLTETLVGALRIALPHVAACAEKDELFARQHELSGMGGAAAECRKAADMRRAAVKVIEDALALSVTAEQ